MYGSAVSWSVGEWPIRRLEGGNKVSMGNEKNTYRFDVSEYYFRLTTECVRLHSNICRSYTTINDVVKDRAAGAASLAKNHPAEYIREHLRLIPTSGDIPIEIIIEETNATHIDCASKSISEVIGASVAFADALSVIMFDFMYEANRTEVLSKIGLTLEEARRYRKILKSDAPGSKSIN